MAAKFRFRLQPVLDLRERVEREKQLRVAELERERIAIEAKLRQCQHNIQSAKMDLRGRLGARGGRVGVMVVIPEVRAQANASLHLEATARHAAMELAGAYRRVERARLELMHAATERRAVELLREKRLEEWRLERSHAEAAQVDEVATQQFIRARASAESGES